MHIDSGWDAYRLWVRVLYRADAFPLQIDTFAPFLWTCIALKLLPERVSVENRMSRKRGWCNYCASHLLKWKQMACQTKYCREFYFLYWVIAVVRYISSVYPLSGLENGCMDRWMDEADHCNLIQPYGWHPTSWCLGTLPSPYFPSKMI